MNQQNDMGDGRRKDPPSVLSVPASVATPKSWRIRTMGYIATATAATAMEAAVAAFQADPPKEIGALVSAMPEGGTDDDEVFMSGERVCDLAGFEVAP